MSIITRNDGTSFVIQAYRELLKYKKRSLISQRVRDISQEQGQFVRLYKRRSGEYEAVFSTEPGYLLGECIKYYFQNVKNLIYCESSQDEKQLLLIVIKDGSVFIDTLISKEQLKVELLSLTTLDIKFQVVVSGNLLKSDEHVLLFPEKLILSYEHISEPLFPRLPLVPNVKLLLLPLALKSERLNNDSLLTTGIILIIGLMTLIGLFTYSQHVDHKKTHIIEKSIESLPYADYIAALKSPSPGQMMSYLSNMMNDLYELSGWSILSVTQIRDEYRVNIQSAGGTLQQMQQWATDHDFTAELTPVGVTLITHINLPERPPIAHIFPLNQLNEKLIDDIQQISLNCKIQLLQTILHHDSQETLISIDFPELSPEQLDYLKDILNKLPIVLNRIEISIQDDLLIHGILQVSVWGK